MIFIIKHIKCKILGNKNRFNGLLAESLVTKNNISKGLFKTILKLLKKVIY
jgi:hypothetical protein